MKKQLTAVLLMFVLLLNMTGCSAAYAIEKSAAPREKVVKAPTEPVRTEPAATENAGMLTEAQAVRIALDHLGFTADQVTRLHTEFEVDDGIPQFDVEFHRGDWEYEFEIHAETGKILSFDKDHKYD